MLSTQLIILNYLVILPLQRSTTVSLETYPLHSFAKLYLVTFESNAHCLISIVNNMMKTRWSNDNYVNPLRWPTAPTVCLWIHTSLMIKSNAMFP